MTASAQRVAAHTLEVRGFPRGGVVRPEENNHDSVERVRSKSSLICAALWL